MALVTWDEAADQILVDVPGCEWPMARLKLIESAREFFETSQAWVEVCAPLTTAAGVADYDVLDLREAAVCALGDVYVAGTPITPITPARYKELVQRDASRGFPRLATWMQDLLWLHNAPSATGDVINASLVLKPSKTAQGLASHLWESYIDALVEGAKYRLFNSPGKPYSNPGAASTAFEFFKKAMEDATIVAEQGRTSAVQRTTASFF